MKQIHPVLCIAFILLFTAITIGKAAVDLKWSADYQVVHVGDQADVSLYALSDTGSNVPVSALEVIMSYDLAHLDFYELLNPGQSYNWLMSGFLSPSPDNLNVALDDGLMFYSAWAQLGNSAIVTPKGLHVTKLRFSATAPAARTYITIPTTYGTEAKTRVFDGTIPNTDIKGDLGAAAVMIVPADYISSVAELKHIGDNITIHLAGPIVTRRFESYFYLEDYDRTAGIRVDCDPALLAAEETTPVVTGSLQTIAGERVLVASAVTPGDYMWCPKPLALTTRALAGGLIPQGLLVRMVGKVMSTSEEDGTFVISDGSGFDVRVELHGTSMPGQDDFIQITGVVGADLSGPIIRIGTNGIEPPH